MTPKIVICLLICLLLLFAVPIWVSSANIAVRCSYLGVISKHCDMFADDTQIGTASKDINSITETLNSELENISDWMAANKLSLNKSKTVYVIIGSHQK